MDHFIKFARPTPEEKVLLILDGHKSHTQAIRALQKASESGIIMVSLPPHTSHRLQPLDLSFFKPLKTYYYQQLERWMRAHPGRAVTQFQVACLFGAAYGKAASVSTCLNGFRKSGIYPLNKDVFEDYEFLPSDVTERPQMNATNDSVALISNSDIVSQNDSAGNAAEEHLSVEAASEENIPVEECEQSSISDVGSRSASTSGVVNNHMAFNSFTVHVEDISPLPKKIPSGEKRKVSKSTILTSSPHKKSINITETPRNTKRKLQRKKLKMSKKVKPAVQISNISSECLVCGDNYDEDWIQCCRCEQWVHEACANITNSKYYFCDNCV